MSSTLDAAMAEQDAQDVAQAETPEQPQPTIRTATFDDLLPDTDDIPQSFRKQPVKALFEDRTKAVQERDRANQQRNELETRVRVAEAALAVLGQNTQTPPPAAPPAKRTPADLLKARNIDTTALYTDPDRVLSAAIEAGAEMAKSELAEELAGLKQQLADITGERAVEKTESQKDRIRRAHASAGRTAATKYQVNEQQWIGDAEFLASWVLARGKDVTDPNSYEEAADALYGRFKPSATPPPAAPPAPPVGSGASAPVASSGSSYLSMLTTKERETLNDLTAGFGERVKISPERIEKIARDVYEGRKGRRR